MNILNLLKFKKYFNLKSVAHDRSPLSNTSWHLHFAFIISLLVFGFSAVFHYGYYLDNEGIEILEGNSTFPEIEIIKLKKITEKYKTKQRIFDGLLKSSPNTVDPN